MFKKEDYKRIVQPAVEAFKSAPWDDRNFYMMYLSQAYYYTRYSTRMLAYAAGRSSITDDHYYKRSVQHIKEEHGHENLALSDFKSMNGKLEDYPELATTKAFWEPQFYKMSLNPKSLLGYVISLEYRVILGNEPVLQKLLEKYGKKSCHFIRVHTEEDHEHIDKAFEELESASPTDQAAVWENFVQSCRLYELFINEIIIESKRKSLKQAA